MQTFYFGGLRVNYYDPWASDDDDEDDEEDCFGLNHDEDDEHQGMSVYLHSGKLQVRNRGQLVGKMEEAKQLILQKNNGPIRGKTNLYIKSIGDVCFKVIDNTRKPNEEDTRIADQGAFDIKQQLPKRYPPHIFHFDHILFDSMSTFSSLY